MASFGDELRALRRRHQLTQQSLSDALDNELSRVTIANVETGRQAPSPRLWRKLEACYPDERARLQPVYGAARREQEVRRSGDRPGRMKETPVDGTSRLLGGTVVVERYDVIYVFRDSQAPEEIIELWQVRAARAGAHDFALILEQMDSTKFEVEPEVLYGGQLVSGDRLSPSGQTLYFRRLEFGRQLRRGEVHRFGLRYWVERDPEPGDFVLVVMTIPAETVGVHVNFLGGWQPGAAWRFGPVADDALAPGEPAPGDALAAGDLRCVSAEFRQPELGTGFGVAWK